MRANKSVWLSGLCILGFVLSVMLTGCPGDSSSPDPGTSDPAGEGPGDATGTEKPTDEPATGKPTDEPATGKPTDDTVTDKPTDDPFADKPTDDPFAEKPSDEPVTEKPSDEPVTEKPSDEPVTDKPTDDPFAEKPSDEPVTEKPTDDTFADKPSDDMATEKPTDEPVTEKPADDTATETPADDTATETPADETVVELDIPLGLPPLPLPETNPLTDEKIELGKLLYFDKRLSKDGTIACATCHDPKMAWTEHKPTSTGIKDQVGGANSPTVINAAYATAQFWDGRAASLEEQALGPIENLIEMGHKLDDLVPQLNEIAEYKERFQKVFGTDVTKDGIAKAIAAFERTVLSGNSPYDKFKDGDEDALTDAQKKGMELFEDIGCATCHTPPMFSNYRYYNAGVGMVKDPPDAGRKGFTKKESDLGKFRVPMLREVANTGPYFHDGSCDTLEKAVALMAVGGKDNDNLSVMLKAMRDRKISEEDQKNIVEFLKALSGEFPVIAPPELP